MDGTDWRPDWRVMAVMLCFHFWQTEAGSRDFCLTSCSTISFIKIIEKLNRKKNSSFVIFEDTIKNEVSLDFWIQDLSFDANKSEVHWILIFLQPTYVYRVARFVLNRYHTTSSVTWMLETLQWPKLESRWKNARRLMLFKLIYQNTNLFNLWACLVEGFKV